ncbi:MAG: hypothetical protein NC131_08170 [Roseburia sp.]|nr:hypothetical protein [Roseburia sp.]
MKIIITQGAYGWRPSGNGQVKTVRSGQSCDVSPEEAARLVTLGVAEYAPSEGVATPTVDADKPGQGTTTPPSGTPGEGQETASLDPEQLQTMTNANLIKLAADMGVDAATLRGKNKAQLIEIILAVKVEVPDGEGDDEGDQVEDDDTVEDGDTPPTVDAEGPVS